MTLFLRVLWVWAPPLLDCLADPYSSLYLENLLGCHGPRWPHLPFWRLALMLTVDSGSPLCGTFLFIRLDGHPFLLVWGRLTKGQGQDSKASWDPAPGIHMASLLLYSIGNAYHQASGNSWGKKTRLPFMMGGLAKYSWPYWSCHKGWSKCYRQNPTVISKECLLTLASWDFINSSVIVKYYCYYYYYYFAF